MTEAMSPDCLIAQGTESNEVPIIVFQMAKLKEVMFYTPNYSLRKEMVLFICII